MKTSRYKMVTHVLYPRVHREPSRRMIKAQPHGWFREIGFDPDRIFFLQPRGIGSVRLVASPTEQEVAEFIAYWEHQVAIAKEYVANDCNPITRLWKAEQKK